MWDHREPTDEELLVYDIESDAEFSDSHMLSQRQQENWGEFQDRVKRDNTYALHALDRSLSTDKPVRVAGGAYFLSGDAEVPKHPMWWELWTPPKGVISGAETYGQQLLKRGIVTMREECDTHDVCTYSSRRLTTVLDSYKLWLDFMPDNEWSFFETLQMLGYESPGNYQNIRGSWGWWQGGSVGFRSKMFSYKVTCDPDAPERGLTGFAAQMLYPPPYGCWLPALDFDRAGDT